MHITTTAFIIFTALLLAANLKESHEARILAVYPVQSKSHMAVNLAVVKELAKRGHDVTVVSAFPEEKPIPNYRNIVLKKWSLEELISSDGDGAKFDPYEMMEMSYFQKVLFIYFVGNKMCSVFLPEEPMQNLMKSNEKYDLIFLEAFYTDCFFGFAHKFKAPVVLISTFFGTEHIGDMVGNPTPYAYVPDPLQEFDGNMNFKERMMNTLGYIVQKLAWKCFIREQNAIMRKFFNDPDMPSIEELQKSTALVLVNRHFSISTVAPLVPNFVEVGGMHVEPPKKLPSDLQKFMDEAKDGVIYFSMGSTLKSANMPEETVEAFTNAFSKLKQKVIWKWEEDSLPGQPPNLKLGKWLPQSDILAHPNLKLFITHGGLLSTQETIHRGVPVVGIPIVGDQKLNMAKTVSLGVGKILEFKNISEESITWTIKEVLENPKYRENAQRISRIFRDQPLSPLEQAVFWSEYVIRHKGAPHLRSAALNLAWYQYFLLDVIAVLTLATAVVATVIFLIFRAMFRLCFGGSKNKSKVHAGGMVSAKKKKN